MSEAANRQWGDHYEDNKWSAEADEIEWLAVVNGDCPFEGAQLEENTSGQFSEDQSLADSAGSVPVDGNVSVDEQIKTRLAQASEDRTREDLVREARAIGVQKEVRRRSALLKGAYPFKPGSGGIAYNPEAKDSHKVYVEMLKLTQLPSQHDRNSFEALVAKALNSYLGPNSRTICFGWRREKEAEIPRRIKQKFEQLEKESGEWTWSPTELFPSDPAPKWVKDLGIDVVAWIPGPDSRPGQVFLVAQCATGKTDWDTKFHDVSWSRIANWVRPVPQEWGVRCMAIPFHVPNLGHWMEVSREAGLFLDRSRITLLFQGSDQFPSNS